MGNCRKVALLLLFPILLSAFWAYFEIDASTAIQSFPSSSVRSLLRTVERQGKTIVRHLYGFDSSKDIRLEPLLEPIDEGILASKGGGGVGGCCSKLKVEGTQVKDLFYQNIMGVYTVHKDFPLMTYEKKGDLSGKYPVYEHAFPNFQPTEEKTKPTKAYLYYYINEHPKIEETKCKERGCWIISMYDPTPGNYWFGKKWYYILANPTPKCPEGLTNDGMNVFINDEGKEENNMKVTCIEP